MTQAAVQNQTRFVEAPWAPQFSFRFGCPGRVTYAYFTFSVDRTAPVSASLPQMRKTTCSPRWKTLVWVQPMGRGFAPTGRDPLTVSTYRNTFSFSGTCASAGAARTPSTARAPSNRNSRLMDDLRSRAVMRNRVIAQAFVIVS